MQQIGQNTTPHATLEKRLSTTAAAHPDRIAAVDENAAVTLHEFDRRADDLAARVRFVATPGARVAVVIPRGVASLIAPYAVWRAGGIYVPLDWDWPADRIQQILTSSADVVIREEDGEQTVTANAPGDRPTCHTAASDELAYIIHTSGSTGTPKGVQITHTALNLLVDNHQKLIYLPEGITDGPVAMLASTAFDSSLERIALAALGYTVHVVPDALRRSPHRLIEYLRDHHIANLDTVPSHLRVLVEGGLLDRATALRLLIVGGERLDTDLWETIASSRVNAFNVYGPTENTINTTIATVTAGQRPNIGSPLPGVECIILDADARLVPDGEVGELIIGGTQLSPGYAGDPERTAQVFRELNGHRFYWSGDLVRRLPGTDVLEFVGRADDQVKINGYRVEPEDVLQSVHRLHGVREAAITPLKTDTSCRLLVSIVAEDPSRPPNLKALRGQLSQLVPTPMVPAHWMLVPDMPLTVNLKRDHDALRARWTTQQTTAEAEPAPAFTDQGNSRAPTPTASMQETIQTLFGEVLGHQVTDRTAHFFALGGDSLSAMRLTVRLRSQTGVDVDLTDVIKNPTIERLATYLVDRAPHEIAHDGC